MLLLAVLVNLYIKNYAATRERRDGDRMTDTLAEHADPTLHRGEPLIEMDNVGKSYGAIRRAAGHQPHRERRRGGLRAR